MSKPHELRDGGDYINPSGIYHDTRNGLRVMKGPPADMPQNTKSDLHDTERLACSVRTLRTQN